MKETYRYQDTEHCSRHFGSVVESRERVSNKSEEGGGGECCEVGEEQEGKVKTSICLEASHKVDDDGEDDLVLLVVLDTRPT